MRECVAERFIKYVRIDTQSDPNSSSFPSTSKQFDLLNLLKEELVELGLEEVSLDEKGYLMATLPSNVSHSCPVVGFLAHVDTSYEFSGKDVNPMIHENYQGGEIALPSGIIISPKENPELSKYIGFDIITGDGTTLLGADDKAGVAEIMCALKFLIDNPQIPRGKIRVSFSPDEEIGKGSDYFDVKKFGADFAYTVDGGVLGEIECENFNAAIAEFKITGVNVHPGYAKGIMVSSLRVLEHLLGVLNLSVGPENSSGRDGFLHPFLVKGDVSETIFKVSVRDFSVEGFDEKKAFLKKLNEEIIKKFPGIKSELTIKDLYLNMREVIDERPEIMSIAIRAIKEEGIEPLTKVIRGGTDGARLSRMGLPTPNLFAGGSNFHGKKEFVAIQVMEKAVKVIVRIASIVAEKK